MIDELNRLILIDHPRPLVRRITLNRPEKRNALSNVLRGQVLDALQAADHDESVRVSVLRGAGKCFSAGYDISTDLSTDRPYLSAGGIGDWPRHLVEGYFRIWDLAKPVIAQVHGYCLAGGTELASACDLVYVADDAAIGYPPVRSLGTPDLQIFPWTLGLRRAMEMMLTGDAISGKEAAEYGFATRAFSAAALEDNVLAIAERIALIPADQQQLNKRSVHRQMEAMGLRNGLRANTELQALTRYTATRERFIAQRDSEGLNRALSDRDSRFGDYRTKKPDAD
jgi:enoyl-CoA hydratase